MRCSVGRDPLFHFWVVAVDVSSREEGVAFFLGVERKGVLYKTRF